MTFLSGSRTASTTTTTTPPAPQQANVRDAMARERLEALLTQTIHEVQNRGKVSGIKASARSWKNTFKGPSATDAATFVFNKGTALVVALILIPVLAVSVGTFGAAPIAAAIVGLAAFGTKKLAQVAQHASDVKKILALMKSGTDPEDNLVINWADVQPELDGPKAKENVEQADRIFAKLVGDVKKLTTEIDAWTAPIKGAKTPAMRTAALAMLLKAEQDALSTANAETLRNTATVRPQNSVGATWNRPMSNAGIRVKLYPLATKSSAIPAAADKIVHRLRRIRFYIRWCYEYAQALEGAAWDAVDAASKAEEIIMGAAFLQVHLCGNHKDCGDLCFGPRDSDLIPDALTTIPVERVAALTSGGRLDMRRTGATAARVSDEISKREKVENKIFEKAVDKLVTSHAENAVAEAVGQIGGSVVGEWAGGFVGDAIGAAVDQAIQTFRVNRPLQNRVAILQSAIRNNPLASLDADIVKLAKDNDLRAVLRAFAKAQMHYPKRIKERSDKLEALLKTIQTSPATAAGRSPFAKCEHAATAVRYLLKVQHASEKQQIHVLFFKYGLEAIDNQVFREGYKRLHKEVTDELLAKYGPGKDRKLRHVVPQQRLVIDDFEWQIRRQRQKVMAQKVQTRVTDPLQIERDFYEMLDEALPLTRLMSRSFINSAAFAHEKFKQQIQAPGLDGAVMSLKDWQAASNVRFRPRSKSTLALDTALERYERVANPTLGRYEEVDFSVKFLDRMVKDGEARLLALQQLKSGVDTWLDGKSNNATSGRRPAVMQLQICASAELNALKGLVDNYRQVVQIGSDLGLLT